MHSPAARLRAAMDSGRPAIAMAAHNPLAARLAEEAGFDAIWASGFEFSASLALADVSLVSMAEHLANTRAVAARVRLPVVADLDTGYGNAVNLVHAVREYASAGVGAVVVEDKAFPKVSSLAPGGRQDLVRIEEFMGKIAAACEAAAGGPVVVARTEALIAGAGLAEALRRAAAYAEAGADCILVHSKAKTSEEIEAFIAAWDARVPLVLVPTSYPEMDIARMRATGKVALAIWGNHAIRAAVAGMQQAFARIKADGSVRATEGEIATVEEIFRLQEMAELKELEARFLR